MSSRDTILLFDQKNYKIKVCLLGGTEILKNEFQKIMSSDSLPIENKKNIGVNISKIDFTYCSNIFELYLWNIECNRRFAFLRTIFYHGTEAVIVFISENKIDQIRNYLDEIRIRFPVIHVSFIIVLNKLKEEEVRINFLHNKDLRSLIESNDIKLNTITNPIDIFKQICSFFIEKRETRKNDDNFIINFITLDKVIENSIINDYCDDYSEPTNNLHGINQSFRINQEAIIDYLVELGYRIEENPPNYLKIKNEHFGTFSIFLRNGNVYFTPKKCQNCNNRNCNKYNKLFFVCIEQQTKGWSNKKEFGQPELLLLSKIFALQNEELPISVLKQINKIISCYKG
jgi:hypothetical protein